VETLPSGREGSCLLLFDIDGTLLFSGGAGKRALNRAFSELFGVGDAFADIPVAGRTDSLIFDHALERAKIETDQESKDDFFRRYFGYLKEEIVEPGPKKGLMPGVKNLLEEVQFRSNLVIALLTGNFSRAAEIKLRHFGLWHYFLCGSYGDDAEGRDGLVPIAVDRARELGVSVMFPSDVVVIGDTPLDVRCAQVVGASSIGVATGSFSEQALRDAGAGAVLPDLSDCSRFLSCVDGVTTGSFLETDPS